jgi:hypothetical protein
LQNFSENKLENKAKIKSVGLPTYVGKPTLLYFLAIDYALLDSDFAFCGPEPKMIQADLIYRKAKATTTHEPNNAKSQPPAIAAVYAREPP